MVNRHKVTTISLFLSLIRRKDASLYLINFKKGYYLNIFPTKKSSDNDNIYKLLFTMHLLTRNNLATETKYNILIIFAA